MRLGAGLAGGRASEGLDYDTFPRSDGLFPPKWDRMARFLLIFSGNDPTKTGRGGIKAVDDFTGGVRDPVKVAA